MLKGCRIIAAHHAGTCQETYNQENCFQLLLLTVPDTLLLALYIEPNFGDLAKEAL